MKELVTDKTKRLTRLEKYFSTFRKHIIGIDQEFDSPYGRQKIIYADWTASGRLYGPIEEKLRNAISPFVANTHTETYNRFCNDFGLIITLEILLKHI